METRWKKPSSTVARVRYFIMRMTKYLRPVLIEDVVDTFFSSPLYAPHYVVQFFKRATGLKLRMKLPSLWNRNYYLGSFESVPSLESEVLLRSRRKNRR